MFALETCMYSYLYSWARGLYIVLIYVPTIGIPAEKALPRLHGGTMLQFLSEPVLFCLFDLVLYVPSTIFQLTRDESSWVEPVLS